MLHDSGLPPRLLCDTEFSVNKVRLSPGDSLLLFSDGVTETNNRAGEEFGAQRLFEAINGPGAGRPRIWWLAVWPRSRDFAAVPSVMTT